MKRFILSIFVIFICFLLVPQDLFSATAESVNQQIKDTNNQIKALDNEIAQYQKQITQTSQQSHTLANLIKELTLTRSKLIKEKEQTEKKIRATGLVIGALSTDIDRGESLIDKSRESLGKMLKDLSQMDQTILLERILAEDNLTDVSREYNNIISINEKVRENIKNLNIEKENLLKTKNIKEGEQNNLNLFKKTLVEKETAILVTKTEKDSLLSATKNKESNYKKLLLERQKQRDAFEKKLEDYEAQLKFILNPKLLPGEGSSVLSWPLDKIFVTQLFGKTVAAKRLYTSGSHSGVDFRATIGTPVKSMGDGVVMGTGDTDIYCKGASFGKWVFIKYNNGLSSTFGHLSSISAKAGDVVKTGNVVGLSGNTGRSTGPHLHLTVYASEGADVKTVPSISCNGKTFIMPIAATKAYLDPMLYLPKVPPTLIKNETPRD